MTDNQQAAIEAGARAYDPEAWTAYDRESPSTEGRELMVEYSKSKAESILAAAEPHLRKKWAEELERAMFKVESVHHFGFGEGGIKCLCGFESARNRSRTEHITQAVRGLLEGAEEV